MNGVVVVGAQWGDEGKGKVVDLYSQSADVVVRFAGGANAGHTLVVDGEKIVLHLIPSGVLHPHTECILGQGTVLDLESLLAEIGLLHSKNLLSNPRLWISDRAHVVMPYHKKIDSLRESGAKAIGTTLRGIGPAYEDKVARRGIRLCDLTDRAHLTALIEHNIEAWKPYIEAKGETLTLKDVDIDALIKAGQLLGPAIVDTSERIQAAFKAKKRVLFEGAQGTLLDIDHGTYPFVTSSSAIAGGACTGSGVGPTAIGQVIGITKAYATRVGEGPFPTELQGKEAERLRKAGDEFGATTGRPRRCGWLDMVALRYAARLSGMTGLALTKLDVLTGMGTIRLGIGYEKNGQRLTSVPPRDLDKVKVIYEDMPGWSEPLSECRSLDDFPANARRLVDRIEYLAGCPVVLVSVGSDRQESVWVKRPFEK